MAICYASTFITVTVEAPASSEEIECAVQVEVEVAVEVTAHELVYLLLAGGVQILKNIEVQQPHWLLKNN